MARAPHLAVIDIARRYGGLVAMNVFHHKFIAVSNADYIRHVLVGAQQRYVRSYHYENPVIGAGLLTTDGPKWLVRRRQVNNAFRGDSLERLVPTASAETAQLVARWTAAARTGTNVSLVADMQRLAVTIIGLSLLSTGIDAESAAFFADKVRTATRLMRRRNYGLVRFPNWAPTPISRGLNRSRVVLDAFLRPIIAERRAAPPARRDMLDALLAVRDPETGIALTDAEILDETKTLFVAGFETTSTALSWTLHLISRNPDVGERLAAEVDRELGGRTPELADLARLSYLGQIMNESMRIYPAVYTLGRECVERDEIDGYTIPKGSVMLLSVLAVHHDERYWPDPEVFRPDRFAGEYPRQAFLPFATGKHVCIGNNFALAEMAVVIAMIAQRFRLEPGDDLPVEARANVTLIPAREIPLRLVAR
jgi:cytochrome P450